MEKKTGKNYSNNQKRQADEQPMMEQRGKNNVGKSTAELLAQAFTNGAIEEKNTGLSFDIELWETILSGLRTSLQESTSAQSQKETEEPFFVLLDPESTQPYLNRAWALDRFVLDDSFLYIMSLDPQLHQTDFRTLIFFKDGRLIKTRENSNNVMFSLFELIGFDYDFIRGISTRVSGKDTHCVPYIFGRYRFLPLSGPTRKNSSWINLSKVLHSRTLKGEKGVEVHFVNQHVFHLPVRPQFFTEKVKQASQTVHRQNHLLHSVLTNFDYADGIKEERKHNLLGNALHANAARLSTIPMDEYIQIVQFSLAETALRHPSLRDNPVADEALHLLRENLYGGLPHLRNAPI